MSPAEIQACEGCGQRYDPTIYRSRWRAPSGRSGLRDRVSAQRVDTTGHRSAVHHRAHALATELAREGRVPVLVGHAVPLATLALRGTLRVQAAHALARPLPRDDQWAPLDLSQRSTRARIISVCAREAETWLVDLDDLPSRALLVGLLETVARIHALREPWWIAWGTVLGVPPSILERGESVGRVRGDLWRCHEVLFAREATTTGTLPLFDRRVA